MKSNRLAHRAVVMSSVVLVASGVASAQSVILSDDFNRTAGSPGQAPPNGTGESNWGENNNALGGFLTQTYKVRNTPPGPSSEVQFVDGRFGRLNLGHGVVNYDLLQIPSVYYGGFQASFEFQRGGSGYIAFAVGITPEEIEDPSNPTNIRIGVPFNSTIPETDFGFLFRPQAQTEIWKAGVNQGPGPLGTFDFTSMSPSVTDLLNDAVVRFTPAVPGEWGVGAVINVSVTVNGAASPQYSTTFTSDASGLGYFGFHSNSGAGLQQAAVDSFILSTIADFTFDWNVDADGSWDSGSNWSSAIVPNNPIVPATLGNAISADRTITLGSAVQLASLTVDNTNGAAYTIDLNGGANLNAATLTINNGTLRLDDSAGANAARVEQLDIAAERLLVVEGGLLVVDYTAAAPEDSPLSQIVGYVLNGSLSAAAQAVGVVEASELGLSSFGNVSVDADAILIRGTLAGDSNLDGAVNFTDLLALARSFNQPGSWADGDSDYSGTVDFTDLLAVARNFGASLLLDGSVQIDPAVAADFDSQWALAQVVVPEPAVLGLFVFGATIGLRRRR